MLWVILHIIGALVCYIMGLLVGKRMGEEKISRYREQAGLDDFNKVNCWEASGLPKVSWDEIGPPPKLPKTEEEWRQFEESIKQREK